MDMKLRGMYIARQLSFKGVSFSIEEIPLDTDFKKVYDASVDLVSCSVLSWRKTFYTAGFSLLPSFRIYPNKTKMCTTRHLST